MPLHDRDSSIIEFACLDEISRRSVFRSPCGDDEVDEVVEGSDREMIDFEEEGELAWCSSFGRPQHSSAEQLSRRETKCLPYACSSHSSPLAGAGYATTYLAPNRR